jgi:cell division protein FtsW
MTETLRKYFKGDAVVWSVIVALSIISLLAVYSSTGPLAYRYAHGNTTYYLFKHFTFMVIGFVIIYVTHRIPYKYYSRLSQLFLLISIPLLGMTLVFGAHRNDASRWLTLPGLGFSFQTSDFAKLAIMMYLARVLSLKQEVIKDFKKAFIPLIIPVGLICILILPANFSTAAILFAACLVMLFVGRVNIKHLLALIGVGLVVLTLFISLALLFHKEGRVMTWKSRIESYFSGDSDDNFQAEQSKIAIATGGIIGRGPGKSVERNFLPYPYADFIYAIIVEEYGLTGGVIVIFFYLWLLFRAGIMVRKSDRTFPAFLAFGLTLLLVFQAMVNMAVAVNLFPVTGQTLPLVSMGGTSVLFSCFSLGIILSVSNRNMELEEVSTELANPINKEQVTQDKNDEE